MNVCAIFLNPTMTASNMVRVVRVMSHTNESCHVSAVHKAWVISYMNESRHTWMSAQMFWTPPWLPQMWRVVCFISHMSESCHVCVVHMVWVMSYVNLSCHRWMTAHSHESCHIWISHVTYEWLCQCFEPYYDCLRCGARGMHHESWHKERWGAGVETPKNVRGEIGGWGRVPFNETYAPSLSTIYDGA